MAPVLGSFGSVVLGWALTFLSLFLILLILVQRGRGGGLTGALGGPGGQSAFGTKAGDMFTKITAFTALGWIFLCAYTMWLLGTTTPPPADAPTTAVSAPADAEIPEEQEPQSFEGLVPGGTGESEGDAAEGDAAEGGDAAPGLSAPANQGEVETAADGAAATGEGAATTEQPAPSGDVAPPAEQDATAPADQDASADEAAADQP